MPRTLVIDSGAEIERMLGDCAGETAESGGHSFLFARSDAEALEIMTGERDLDIAVVSIDNPDIGGMGLFRRLSGEKLRIPRIALTSGHDLETIRRAMNDGAVDFLTRPVSLDDLRATINKAYKECEARRESWRTEAQLAAIRREIDIAGEIQKRILPTEFPQGQGFDVYAKMNPAKEMGGDFYDFFEITPDKLGLVIADVSGKGVPAAFFMAVARTLLRATAMTGVAPAVCLEQANVLLHKHNIPGMFVSVFYGILDTGTWEMIYANGGHPPPFMVCENGEAEPLGGGGGTVLGIQDGLSFAEDRVSLEPGCSVLFYTDGLTEAFDSGRNQFSEERLIKSISAKAGQSPRSITESLFADISDFTGDAEQSDDITSLVLKRV